MAVVFVFARQEDEGVEVGTGAVVEVVADEFANEFNGGVVLGVVFDWLEGKPPDQLHVGVGWVAGGMTGGWFGLGCHGCLF